MTNQEINELTESVQDLEAAIRDHSKWFVFVGILLTILGFIAIVMPVATTITVKTILGWLLLIGGVFMIFHAFVAEGWKGVLGNLFLGLLYVLVGGWMVFNLMAGVIGLTVLLASLFLAEGVVKIYLSFRFRPNEGWGWILASGLVALIVGILLIAGLPSTAAWAIGLLTGLNLLSSGMIMMMLGFAGGRAEVDSRAP